MQIRDISICSQIRRIVYGFMTVILALVCDILTNKQKSHGSISKQRKHCNILITNLYCFTLKHQSYSGR